MEILMFIVGLLSIAAVFYVFFSEGGRRLSVKVQMLVTSVIIALMTALWCVVYGPDRWVLIQAGIVLVIATGACLLSSRKG